MSSSSTTDGEPQSGALFGKKPKVVKNACGADEHVPLPQPVGALGPVGAAAGSHDAAARRRPSGIPLPAGFRQRAARDSSELPPPGELADGVASEPGASNGSSGPGAVAESTAPPDSEPPAHDSEHPSSGAGPAAAAVGGAARSAGTGEHLSGPPRPRSQRAAPSSGPPTPAPCTPARPEAARAHAAVEPAPPSSALSPAPLPRLMLAPLAPAELLYERLQEPTTDSPILYRERAYLVDPQQTDDDLEDQLEAELSHIRRDWRHRDASQFVHLSLFDQRFDGEPSVPAIATLSWKDWQGRTEIWVRGVRRSTLPPGVPLSVPPGPEPALATPEQPPPPSVSAASSAESGRVPARVPPSAPEGSTPLRPSAPSDEDVSWLEPEPLLAPLERGDADPLLALEAEPIPLVQRPSARAPSSVPRSETRREPRNPEASSSAPALDSAPASAALSGDAGSASLDSAADRAPDSGPAWQSPERSGEYLIPLPDEESLAPPSSQRVQAGDELMDALFERLHELSGVLTVTAAADYVVSMLGEHIACDGVLISGLDPARNELVVVRASGPRGRGLVGWRVPLDMAPRGPALRQGRHVELGPAALVRSPGLWRALGITAAHALVAPLQRPGRLLGSIELCRGAQRGPFSPGHADALGLVCDQLAEFIGDKPLDLARASLLPKP